MTNQMTNQKELSVRQIRTMFKFIDVFFERPIRKITTKQIEFNLTEEQQKAEIYKLFGAYSENRKLLAKIKRLKLRNSKTILKISEITDLNTKKNPSNRSKHLNLANV